VGFGESNLSSRASPKPAPQRHRKLKISEKDVVYVADLAHLELTEEERIRFLGDLNSILDYVDRLNELDTSHVQAIAQMADLNVAVPDAGREDVLEGLRKSLPHDVALANAPDSDGTFFRVPKVIER
jgi:aspartyl-tRNA(Asn)/glutamyl-tRNA(Gln) amidotransferase subunit C